MSNLIHKFHRAVAAYQSQQLLKAEQLCQKIIIAKRDFFDALHLLAVVQSRSGESAKALESYDRALKVRPDHAEALSNRGLTLHELKRFDDALASYERALKMRPDYAEALYNRGNTLRELKRLDEALTSYERALQVRPDDADALSNRGDTLHQLRRFEEALASYDRALKVRPSFAEALYNRGNSLYELKRLEEALASQDRALEARPNFAEALSNRGLIMHELKRFDEALASYDRALEVQPKYAEALYNRGNTLHELKRFDEALASYDRALEVQPKYAEALYNRGNTLHKLKRLDDALASYDRALEVRPDYAEALNNRGNILHESRRFDEALASYDCALKLRPHFAEAHLNNASCRLLLGDFDHGWDAYEWRFEIAEARERKRKIAQPLWRGQTAIARKRILLHAEQGFGDTIQFCRYVPFVAAHGAHVILEVQRPLQQLMMSNFVHTAQVISAGDPLPDFDLHCPILSLPRAFGTRLATIPAPTPYLHASPQPSHHWEERLGERDRPRIGLVWSGNLAHRNDHNRSIGLKFLLPLLDINAAFVSLQKDLRPDDEKILKERTDICHLGDAFNNFSDTASLMSHLDLVISVDTSVVHLAGAMARPVWVLLPFIPDWRWLLGRDHNPWYPTARLFRQDETRAWDTVIVAIRAALHAFVQEGSSVTTGG